MKITQSKNSVSTVHINGTTIKVDRDKIYINGDLIDTKNKCIKKKSNISSVFFGIGIFLWILVGYYCYVV